MGIRFGTRLGKNSWASSGPFAACLFVVLVVPIYLSILIVFWTVIGLWYGTKYAVIGVRALYCEWQGFRGTHRPDYSKTAEARRYGYYR